MGSIVEWAEKDVGEGVWCGVVWCGRCVLWARVAVPCMSPGVAVGAVVPVGASPQFTLMRGTPMLKCAVI